LIDWKLPIQDRWNGSVDFFVNRAAFVMMRPSFRKEKYNAAPAATPMQSLR
jgi:hypothetical protein